MFSGIIGQERSKLKKSLKSFKVSLKVPEIIQNFVFKFLSILLRSEGISEGISGLGDKFEVLFAQSAIRTTSKYTCTWPHMYAGINGKGWQYHVGGISYCVCAFKKNAVFKILGQDSAKMEQEQLLLRLRLVIMDTSVSLMCLNNARPDGSSLYSLVLQVVRNPLVKHKNMSTTLIAMLFEVLDHYLTSTLLLSLGPSKP